MLGLFELAILLVYVCGGKEHRPRIGVAWPKAAALIVYQSIACLPQKLNFICEPCDDALRTAMDKLNAELATVSGQDHCPGKEMSEITLRSSMVGRVYTEPFREDFRIDLTDLEEPYIISESTVGVRRALMFLLNFLTLHNVQPVSAMKYGENVPGDDPSTMYFTVQQCFIGDSPRYQHRGLMVDTGSHFIGMEVLKRIVRTMSRVDLNVLHWHISDSGSMPLVTPKTSRDIHGEDECRDGICGAAYSNAETYSFEEVKEFIEYAARHGVAVALEASMPGRAMSWTRAGEAAAQRCQSIDAQVHPACDRAFCGETYLTSGNAPGRALENLWGEFQQLSTDIPIHMGGHHTDARCGGQGAQERNFQAFDSFISYHFHDRRSFVYDHGYISDYFIGPNTVVQLNRLTRMDWYLKQTPGRKFIMQLPNLDCGLDNTIAPGFGTNCQYVDWWNYLKSINPEISQRGLLGFEVPIFTDIVDEDTIESLIWPRAAVLAWGERLPTITTNITYALGVQETLTRLMDSIQYSEEVPMTPIYNRWCVNNVTQYCQAYMKHNYDSPTSRFHSS